MKTHLVIWLIRLLLKLMLHHTTIKDLVYVVGNAERIETNTMKKRSMVYQHLKVNEDFSSVSKLNTVVELGLQLYKLGRQK